MATVIPDEMTFVIIKPDALERGLMGEIIKRIENTYLRIANVQMRHKTQDWAAVHYAEHKEREFYKRLCEFMTSAPLVGFTITGPDAVTRVRRLIGSTIDPLPGTVRGDYGHGMYNLVHASASTLEADVEISAFYDSGTDRSELP
jgi:nucleoside-diphosphate kinase